MSFTQPNQTDQREGERERMSASVSLYSHDETNPYVNKKDINNVFFFSAFVSRTIVSTISSSFFRIVCPSNTTVEELLLKGMKYCIEFSGKKIVQ